MGAPNAAWSSGFAGEAANVFVVIACPWREDMDACGKVLRDVGAHAQPSDFSHGKMWIGSKVLHGFEFGCDV